MLTHSSRSVTRLGCLHVLHNSCLLLLLKGSSSPTGYTCPSCKSQSHIFMLDKNSLLPLASELLSNFSEQGFSQPRSEIRLTVFSLSSPLAEMYKDPKSQKAQQNHIPKDQNVLESWETLKSPRKTINIETPKSCSPEIGIAESVGSPKISMVYSRNCSFQGEKKSTDCPVQDWRKGLMHIPSG
ncbi:hypothetical protein SUGI_0352660 [Cryptomeria japonica]|nr:hypothetical protein SUGI_0352660 [Cryptomeria japonica]